MVELRDKLDRHAFANSNKENKVKRESVLTVEAEMSLEKIRGRRKKQLTELAVRIIDTLRSVHRMPLPDFEIEFTEALGPFDKLVYVNRKRLLIDGRRTIEWPSRLEYDSTPCSIPLFIGNENVEWRCKTTLGRLNQVFGKGQLPKPPAALNITGRELTLQDVGCEIGECLAAYSLLSVNNWVIDDEAYNYVREGLVMAYGYVATEDTPTATTENEWTRGTAELICHLLFPFLGYFNFPHLIHTFAEAGPPSGISFSEYVENLE